MIANMQYDDFNHPDALNYDAFMKDVNEVRTTDNKADVIIIEGIFALYFAELREILDLKIFVDADADERLYRRISRNMKNWGVSMEEVATYYLHAAKHREIVFALPTKKYADIIINGHQMEGTAKHIICSWIYSRMNPASP
ncbi:hypothetical protein M3650_28225 [Paenibacillus sp. MER TA 81-3]|uniref:hypothetical protein n=1 Tax=Paenibacillus sp. MER TA 81-3 TaxID=2939573 RepID=UPI0020422B38|nr:hypothetical protein [Paenibacillus sp. MER TA 81-3]MCM3342407.1 hypothetical protein [Paenibacillus sp. MER TA 81-3]